MAIGKRQNQEESPKDELDRLLDELELTQAQREFIESMCYENGSDNPEKESLLVFTSMSTVARLDAG